MKSYITSAVLSIALLVGCTTAPSTSSAETQDVKPDLTVVDGSVSLGQESVVGLQYNIAKSVLDSRNIQHRVVVLDGESLAITMDYVEGRHNLHVNKGTVVRVDVE